MRCEPPNDSGSVRPTLYRRIFGSPENAPNNLAGAAIILAFGVGLLASLALPDLLLEVWQLILPVVTLVFGFVIGRNTKN